MMTVKASLNNWAGALSDFSPLPLQRVVDVFYYAFRHHLNDWPQHPLAAARAATADTIGMLGDPAARMLPGIAEVFVRRFVVWSEAGKAVIGEVPDATDMERVHMHATRFGVHSAKKITARTGIPRNCVSSYLTYLRKAGFSLEDAQRAFRTHASKYARASAAEKDNAHFWLPTDPHPLREAKM